MELAATASPDRLYRVYWAYRLVCTKYLTGRLNLRSSGIHCMYISLPTPAEFLRQLLRVLTTYLVCIELTATVSPDHLFRVYGAYMYVGLSHYSHIVWTCDPLGSILFVLVYSHPWDHHICSSIDHLTVLKLLQGEATVTYSYKATTSYSYLSYSFLVRG